MSGGITFSTRGYGIPTAAFHDSLMAAVDPMIQRAATRFGHVAQQEIVAIVEAEYGPRRTGRRSRSTVHLHDIDAYPFEVRDTPNGAEVFFRKRGGNFADKFKALNDGPAVPHEIRRFGGYLKYPDPEQGGPTVYRKRVWWTSSSGKFGTHFFERGIEAALGDFWELLA